MLSLCMINSFLSEYSPALLKRFWTDCGGLSRKVEGVGGNPKILSNIRFPVQLP
jgi:hypothetical protein